MAKLNVNSSSNCCTTFSLTFWELSDKNLVKCLHCCLNLHKVVNVGKKTKIIYGVAVLLTSSFALNKAYAYIDPATTAILTQIIAGVCISASVAIGLFWRKISVFFKMIFVKLFHRGD